MKHKQKKCNGTGKAIGYGCGELQTFRKYGLGLECRCYQSWLVGSEAGKEIIAKNSLKARRDIAKQERKRRNEFKQQNTDYKPKLQSKINEIARLIDLGQPCLAKGYHAKQMHGGHIYARGAFSQIRYNLHNIHRQSAQSNHFQNEDGLLRDGLKKEYGQEYFDYLTSICGLPPLHFSQAEYKQFYKVASEIALELRRDGKVFSKQERIDKRTELNSKIGIYNK